MRAALRPLPKSRSRPRCLLQCVCVCVYKLEPAWTQVPVVVMFVFDMYHVVVPSAVVPALLQPPA